MSGNKYNLKDFKNIAHALESEFKNHQDVTKLTKKLMTMCGNRGISTGECSQMTPEIIHILNQIWNVKYNSKQTIVNTIAKNSDTTKPLHLSTEEKKGIHIINDMNHQHDVFTAPNKQLVTKIYNNAKPIVTDINKNYNDYYDIWNKMKTLEIRYIRDYRAYYAIKNKTNYNDSDKQKMRQIYKDIIENVIPEFKKLNNALEQLVSQRTQLVEKFYSLYQSIPTNQRGDITLPTTAFEIQKKISHQTHGNQKPKVNVTKCIQKSWQDALKSGFNPTFYAPCHIARQHELISNCNNKFDWPYIAYTPNMYQPWDPSQNYSQWMQTCMKIEQYERPYIGV